MQPVPKTIQLKRIIIENYEGNDPASRLSYSIKIIQEYLQKIETQVKREAIFTIPDTPFTIDSSELPTEILLMDAEIALDEKRIESQTAEIKRRFKDKQELLLNKKNRISEFFCRLFFLFNKNEFTNAIKNLNKAMDVVNSDNRLDDESVYQKDYSDCELTASYYQYLPQCTKDELFQLKESLRKCDAKLVKKDINKHSVYITIFKSCLNLTLNSKKIEKMTFKVPATNVFNCKNSLLISFMTVTAPKRINSNCNNNLDSKQSDTPSALPARSSHNKRTTSGPLPPLPPRSSITPALPKLPNAASTHNAIPFDAKNESHTDTSYMREQKLIKQFITHYLSDITSNIAQPLIKKLRNPIFVDSIVNIFQISDQRGSSLVKDMIEKHFAEFTQMLCDNLSDIVEDVIKGEDFLNTIVDLLLPLCLSHSQNDAAFLKKAALLFTTNVREFLQDYNESLTALQYGSEDNIVNLMNKKIRSRGKESFVPDNADDEKIQEFSFNYFQKFLNECFQCINPSTQSETSSSDKITILILSAYLSEAMEQIFSSLSIILLHKFLEGTLQSGTEKKETTGTHQKSDAQFEENLGLLFEQILFEIIKLGGDNSVLQHFMTLIAPIVRSNISSITKDVTAILDPCEEKNPCSTPTHFLLLENFFYQTEGEVITPSMKGKFSLQPEDKRRMRENNQENLTKLFTTSIQSTFDGALRLPFIGTIATNFLHTDTFSQALSMQICAIVHDDKLLRIFFSYLADNILQLCLEQCRSLKK